MDTSASSRGQYKPKPDGALILGNEWFEDLLAACLELGERAGFIGLHQPAEANNVGGKYGGEPALHCRLP